MKMDEGTDIDPTASRTLTRTTVATWKPPHGRDTVSFAVTPLKMTVVYGVSSVFVWTRGSMNRSSMSLDQGDVWRYGCPKSPDWDDVESWTESERHFFIGAVRTQRGKPCSECYGGRPVS